MEEGKEKEKNIENIRKKWKWTKGKKRCMEEDEEISNEDKGKIKRVKKIKK